jgi:hypothetical protein
MEFTKQNLEKFCRCKKKDQYSSYFKQWINKWGFPYVMNKIFYWFPEDEEVKNFQHLMKIMLSNK